jgi:hypothetical protein
MANHERLLSTHIERHLSLCIVQSSKDERSAFAAELQPHQYVQREIRCDTTHLMSCRFGSKLISLQRTSLQLQIPRPSELPDDSSLGTMGAVANSAVDEAVGEVDGEFDGFTMTRSAKGFGVGHVVCLVGVSCGFATGVDVMVVVFRLMAKVDQYGFQEYRQDSTIEQH